MSLTLHTTHGDIKIELHCRLVKRSCANFLALAASNRYDKTKFHRVVPSFIIQGGDPTNRGKTSRAAFARRLPDEPNASLTFAEPGVVAFANKGSPSPTGVGSQFFITLAEAHHLDGTCTIIGRVIDGMQAVEAIAAVELDDRGVPTKEQYVESVTIHANPFATADVEFDVHST